MGQRRIHEQRLRGNFLLLVGPHVLERAHVVQAVRKLDQNHAHVVAQREQHLAEVLGLGARPWLEHTAHLCQPIHNGPFLGPKQTLHIVKGHVRVLHGVVQECAHDARGSQAHFLGNHPCHGDGVVDVGLSTLAADVLVRVERDIEGLADGLALRAFLGIFRSTQQPPVPPKNFLLFCFQIERHRYASSAFLIQPTRLLCAPMNPRTCTTFAA